MCSIKKICKYLYIAAYGIYIYIYIHATDLNSLDFSLLTLVSFAMFRPFFRKNSIPLGTIWKWHHDWSSVLISKFVTSHPIVKRIFARTFIQMDVNIAIQNQAKNDLKMYLKESTAQRQHLIDSYDRFLCFFLIDRKLSIPRQLKYSAAINTFLIRLTGKLHVFRCLFVCIALRLCASSF